MISRRSRLAGFLLSGKPVVAVAAAALTGCLAVQDIQEYQEPPVVNHPPQLDLVNGVVPDVTTVQCLTGESDDPPEFRIANVRDRNGLDNPPQNLSVRWFFDYHRQVPGSDMLASDTIKAQLDPVTQASTEVYGSSVLDTKTVLDKLTQANDALPHVLEAVVSDGFARVKEPRNRAAEDGFYTVSYKWVVAKGRTLCQ